MKITAQEEYGLRILLCIAKSDEGMSIAQVSDCEGLSHHNAAKICRILRMHDFITSKKGHTGGYTLARHANEIALKDVLHALGGSLFDESFCSRFTGDSHFCTNSTDCSVRSLWKVLQSGIDKVLMNITLAQLLGNEQKVESELCKDDD
jgi:Rrf2 family protein